MTKKKKFTREELIHALRSCATMGAECEQCEFYEADTPRGYSPCHESLLLTKAADFIESIPSAEPERKWIPVTEALPEDNRQVLVYAQSTHFALAKYDEMMEPNGEWKKQWVTFDAWKPYYTVKNVIAWMPLPKPAIIGDVTDEHV